MTREDLIQAQEGHFPGSRIMTHQEVHREWLLERYGDGRFTHSLIAAASIASTLLQYPAVVFYEWHGYRGARYGLLASEYISGFGS
jgi:hypothetical protein